MARRKQPPRHCLGCNDIYQPIGKDDNLCHKCLSSEFDTLDHQAKDIVDRLVDKVNYYQAQCSDS
ncbi:MAG: hypothetical protein GY928_30975 [Colwellia sp.]|nr:hypothetical protein [Colwellia sp.]